MSESKLTKQGVIYVRNHNTSDNSQESLLLNYCNNNNIQVVDKFIDHCDDTMAIDRPELQKLLKSLRPSMVVVCANISRLSRNFLNIHVIMRAINSAKASLIILEHALDTSTPVGQLNFNMITALHEYEDSTKIKCD